jgi:nicotinamidase-related amidase
LQKQLSAWEATVAQALLVIDVQRVYTDKNCDLFCKNANETVDRINELISLFKRTGELVVYVRHIHRKDGSDLGRMFDYLGEAEEEFNFKEDSDEVAYDPRLIQVKNSLEIVKNRYSAFAGTALHEILRQREIDTVVVCGFMTNFCCDSTAREAHDRDYFVDFIIDATGTPGTDHMSQAEVRKAVGELHAAGFSRVAKTKSFLAQKRGR